MSDTPCGPDGCVQLKALKDNTSEFVTAVNEFRKTTEALTETVMEMNTNLRLQNLRLEHGTEEFGKINKRIASVEHEISGSENNKGLRTRVSVLEDKMPSKKGAIIAGGSSAGGGIVIWEIIKALISAKTGQ